MCQYCEKRRIIGEWKPDRLSIRIEKDLINENHCNLVVSIDAWEYTEKINFCPMCGRKLEGK